MTERREDRPSSGDDSWLVRDLPTAGDPIDDDGIYGTKFGELWFTDSEYEWPDLLDWYQQSDREARAIINRVFIHLIGYTLPSLVQLANGASEEDLT